MDKNKRNLILSECGYVLAIAAIVLCSVFIPKACQKKTEYKLDVACTNCSVDNQTELHNFYPENDVVTLTFKANDNYSLPEDIKATSGNKQLIKGTDYTYSAASGEFTFTITGDTEVNCEAFSNTELRFEVKIPANTDVDIAFYYNPDKYPYSDDYPGTIDWGDGTTDSKLNHRYKKSDKEETYVTIAKDFTYDYFKFYDMSGYQQNSVVQSIILPTSIKTLGYHAFCECSFTSIVLPNNLIEIRESAFYYCSFLTSIALPNSITYIGSYAFSGCSSLTSITIPNSVTSIDSGVFNGCSSLTSITIPNSVTSINDYAFYDCSSLTTITIPSSVTLIGYEAFYSCSSLSSITIPSGVTSIGYGAFEYCSSLTSITIPNSVTSIYGYAFNNINANAVVDMSDVDHLIPLTGNIFCIDEHGAKFVGTIKVKESLINDYKTADYWKNTADRFVGV